MSNLFTRAVVLKSYSPPIWRIHWLSFIALLTASFATAVMAQPQVSSESLSLENALQLAEHRSQALLAQDAAAQASQELAIEAGQLPDPMLELSVNNLPVNGPMAYSLTEDFMTSRNIGISQTYTREAKRHARANVFELKADKAQITKKLTLTEIRQNTALAWFDGYYQQQMVELLTREQQEASLQVEAAEAIYRAGTGPQSDIFLAKTTVAEIQDRIHQAQARLENAKTTLSRWVGDINNISLDAAPDITQSPLDTQHLYHQVSEHPDIAVMRAEEAVAMAEAKVARQEKQSDWTWSVMYGERSSGFSDMISIGVSVPLQWNQESRQDRVVAAKLAQADQVRAEREEMTREHIAETARWLDTWKSNLVRLSDYETALIPLASQRTNAALAEYRGGKGELQTVFDARKMEIATRLEKLRIEMETAALWATLEYLILPDSTVIPSSRTMEFK
ncbi:TolC family protein [Methylophaga nitratireducenticrescens]|uniref:Heavy metal RND efflux outer membrane protein, CzcC family n=1 Tax=Methylophaga nitratireducenticrescens TaxID=754476 RepID=I1XJT0_METNJ|nr:TolC family protein [Methylophaga nitratireducenticrescens]AFI84649.1 TolC family protein [Methylophaga nitratireducenticrescens]AUZ84660.1 TolC family protein [Methylophaga nitratireducenticrescens]